MISMTDVVVGGATGRLGNLVCRMISESGDLNLAGAVVSENSSRLGEEVYGVKTAGSDGLFELVKSADVYVDVTTPEAAAEIIADIPETGCNLVVGTTAIPEEVLNRMAANTAKYGTSSLVTASFAPGVHVFWKVCEILAGYLPGHDVEVLESHHRGKIDAPSGTAVETVNRLMKPLGTRDVLCGREGEVGARGKEIGVHSIRAGDIVGDHTVCFAKGSEVIEFTHRADSREVFARGCVASVRWIADKKDGKVHNMEEVLGIC